MARVMAFSVQQRSRGVVANTGSLSPPGRAGSKALCPPAE